MVVASQSLFTLDSVEVAKLNQDPRFSGILPRRFQNYSKIYLCQEGRQTIVFLDFINEFSKGRIYWNVDHKGILTMLIFHSRIRGFWRCVAFARCHHTHQFIWKYNCSFYVRAPRQPLIVHVMMCLEDTIVYYFIFLCI